MSEKQTTISTAVHLSGVGLHTGCLVNMRFVPAPENHGYVFKRIDLEGQPMIEADADWVVDISRGTTLGKNGATIATVEHALAALRGSNIDNILIEIDGPEIPIMDGSAMPFMDALATVQVVEQDAPRKYYELTQSIRFYDPEKDVEIIAIPNDTFRVTTMIDYQSPVLGTQHATLNSIEEFKTEIAACRTFCFLHELEILLNNNLIKGGDLSNAIVVVDKEIDELELKKLSKIFGKSDISVAKEGILNNIELRFQNEPARHKLLDVVGDLALVGQHIKAHIVASKPGHSSNVAFAKTIKSHIKKNRNKLLVPQVNPNQVPVYDVNQIMAILPHRHPFVLVDKVLEMTDTHVVGVKSVTFNEYFFQGHFPNNPVMPGVLIIEAMAQTGGILCLNTMDDPKNYWTYFLKIDNAKFKDKVVPGDLLVFRLDLTAPIRRGICQMHGIAYVGEKIVAEADLMAQLAKKS